MRKNIFDVKKGYFRVTLRSGEHESSFGIVFSRTLFDAIKVFYISFVFHTWTLLLFIEFTKTKYPND